MWGGRGQRKRERVGHHGKGKGFPLFPSSHRPPRAFYFFDYCYFYRDIQREPLRRRRVLKYVAFEKRLKEGGKKSRGGSQECKVTKAGGLNPLLPLKRSELNHATDMMEEYKGMAAMLFLSFKFVRSEIKESFVSRVNALLVGMYLYQWLMSS